MTVRITLTDDVLPPSHSFIDFLRQWLSGATFHDAGWARDGGGGARGSGLRPPNPDLLASVDALVAHDQGLRCVTRAYDLFVALLLGDTAALQTVHDRFRFVLVVGVPRSGGKYLTKQLFRALGHDPARVPDALGHDAYPDAGPWRFGAELAGGNRNGWTSSLQTMAEYLTMVELYFGGGTEPVVVPNKSTKAAYAAGLFGSAFGPATEAVVTVRHPVPACVSTYEAGGGLPADGRFSVRGNIEWFCARELRELGFSRDEIAAMDYFDAYLRYWENYHVRLAMSIKALASTSDVVAYGAESYTRQAQRFAERYGAGDCWIEPFHLKDRRRWPLEWLERSTESIDRVAAQWDRVGLRFPADGVDQAW